MQIKFINKFFDIVSYVIKFYKWGQLSERAAQKIDYIYLEDTTSFFAKTSQIIKIGLVYSFLFSPLVAVDFFCSLALTVLYGVGGSVFFSVKFSSIKRQTYLNNSQKNSQKYAVIFVKNFATLVVLPIGLINVRLITFFFLPPLLQSRGIVSGSKLHKSNVLQRESTAGLKNLKRIIKTAASQRLVVLIVGAGHSQGEQFLPPSTPDKPIQMKGFLIDLSHFNKININVTDKTANVGAGATFGELQCEANKYGLAVQVMQASNVFSIGGSISTNVHGWNHRAGTLNNTIKSLVIIDGRGNRFKLNKFSPEFNAVTGGYGLIGVIIEAEIILVDNKKLIEKTTLIAIKNYPTFFKEANKNPLIKMHVCRLPIDGNWHKAAKVFAVNYEKIQNDKDENEIVISKLKKEPSSGFFMDRVKLNTALRLPSWLRISYASSMLKKGVHRQPIKTTNEIMQPSINAAFNSSVSECGWLQEYFIPEAKLINFLHQLGLLLIENNVVLLNATIRFVKKDKFSILNYAKTDCYAVVLFWNQPLSPNEVEKTKNWVKQSIDLTLENNGVYYLPYQNFPSKNQFFQAYDLKSRQKFLEIKNKLDPYKVFSSGFYETYFDGSISKFQKYDTLSVNDVFCDPIQEISYISAHQHS